MPPRPNTPVIHPRWEEHHRPVADGTHTATITFKRPSGPPVFDDTTGTTTQPTATVFSGPCRIQELGRGDQITIAAGQRITDRRYQVSLSITASDLQLDDIGTVDTANDPSLPGRPLRVIDVQRGSLTFERNLICIDDLED